MTPDDHGREKAENKRRNGRWPENKDVEQDGTDHGAKEEACADELKTGDPQQDSATDFDHAGQVSEPLTPADLVECADHHFDAGKLGDAGRAECESEKCANCKHRDIGLGTGHGDLSGFGTMPKSIELSPLSNSDPEHTRCAFLRGVAGNVPDPDRYISLLAIPNGM